MYDDLFKNMKKDFDKELGVKFPELRLPLSHIEDRGNEIIIKIDLPDIDKKDIELEIIESFIEVKTRRKDEIEIKKKNFYKKEKSFLDYYKVIPLPENADIDKISAKYKDGILTIKIPRKDGVVLEYSDYNGLHMRFLKKGIKTVKKPKKIVVK